MADVSELHLVTGMDQLAACESKHILVIATGSNIRMLATVRTRRNAADLVSVTYSRQECTRAGGTERSVGFSCLLGKQRLLAQGTPAVRYQMTARGSSSWWWRHQAVVMPLKRHRRGRPRGEQKEQSFGASAIFTLAIRHADNPEAPYQCKYSIFGLENHARSYCNEQPARVESFSVSEEVNRLSLLISRSFLKIVIE
ncbi:hypothetical protein T06_7113 [Trichinella sp. T6]|nr:hypothetical protein T06_7113 [Trichinella sp. T6]